MSKERKCDWCGETIGEKEVRVKLPPLYEAPAFTYHAACYCRVYARDCIKSIVTDDWTDGDTIKIKTIGEILAAILPNSEP